MVRARSGFVQLVIVTAIWGTTFPLVKTLGETLSAPTIITVRFVVAAVALAPWLRNVTWPKVRDGMILGSVSFASYATQTIGLERVTSGRAAFVTALNVILVPLALPLLGRRIHRLVFVAAGLALFGVGLLSWDRGALRLSVGDLWVLACAIAYAAYVLLLERFAPRYDVLELSAIQILWVSALGAAWLLLDSPAEKVRSLMTASGGAWATLVYLGVVAVAISTLLQTHAQRTVPAPTAAIVYSLEPVFGAAASFAWRDERLAPLALVGAGMIVVAMIVSQRAPPA